MITHYCIIRKGTIIRDGKILFADDKAGVNEFLLNAYTSLAIDYPKYYKMDNLSKLGFLAAEVLLKEWKANKAYAPEEIALVLSNTSGSLDTDMRYWESTKNLASPALFVYTLSNIVAGEICIRHKIKGENAFFVSPAFDAALIADYVESILSQASISNPNAVIGGWVEVLGEHYDVFLYLTEKKQTGLFSHTAEHLNQLYHSHLWNN